MKIDEDIAKVIEEVPPNYFTQKDIDEIFTKAEEIAKEFGFTKVPDQLADSVIGKAWQDDKGYTFDISYWPSKEGFGERWDIRLFDPSYEELDGFEPMKSKPWNWTNDSILRHIRTILNSYKNGAYNESKVKDLEDYEIVIDLGNKKYDYYKIQKSPDGYKGAYTADKLDAVSNTSTSIAVDGNNIDELCKALVAVYSDEMGIKDISIDDVTVRPVAESKIDEDVAKALEDVHFCIDDLPKELDEMFTYTEIPEIASLYEELGHSVFAQDEVQDVLDSIRATIETIAKDNKADKELTDSWIAALDQFETENADLLELSEANETITDSVGDIFRIVEQALDTATLYDRYGIEVNGFSPTMGHSHPSSPSTGYGMILTTPEGKDFVVKIYEA